MMSSFEDQFKKTLSDWRTRFEEMQVQFSLGKMDAAEAFEKQKDMLRKSIVDWKSNAEEATDKGEAYANELRTRMDELMVQLNLGKAEGKELFEEQRKKIEAAMHEVKVAGKKAYNEQFEKMMDLYEQNSGAFKTGLEILQLQFSLAKMKDPGEAEEVRKQMKTKMEELNAMYVSAQQEGMKNLENMTKQMQEGYDQFKKWAEGWMKK